MVGTSMFPRHPIVRTHDILKELVEAVRPFVESGESPATFVRGNPSHTNSLSNLRGILVRYRYAAGDFHIPNDGIHPGDVIAVQVRYVNRLAAGRSVGAAVRELLGHTPAERAELIEREREIVAELDAVLEIPSIDLAFANLEQTTMRTVESMMEYLVSARRRVGSAELITVIDDAMARIDALLLVPQNLIDRVERFVRLVHEHATKEATDPTPDPRDQKRSHWGSLGAGDIMNI